MAVTTPKRKRNRLLVILALPALALIWLVGWSLYWIGCKSDNKPKLQSKQTNSKENVTLITASTLEQNEDEEEQIELSV